MDTEAQINILLVDDRKENLLALEAVLERPEYNLVTATSGKEALRRLEEQDFALILLDVQMPIMDGFETAKRIKANERTRHIPIIFVTAISREERFVFSGYSAGAVDYLIKPLDADIIQAKVKVFADLYSNAQRLRALSEDLHLKAQIPDLAADAIFVSDETGKLLYVNPSTSMNLGYTQEELLKKNAFQLVNPDYLKLLAHQLDVLKTSGDQVFVASLSRRDGSILPVEIHSCLIRINDTIHILQIARDIQERLKAEETLLRAYAQLEDRVKERTAALTQANLALQEEIAQRRKIEQEKAILEGELRQAQKLEAIRTLAGGIAHDFNNILGIIMGYTEMSALGLAPDHPLAHNLQHVIQASHRAKDLIKQILAFSRKVEQDRRPFHLSLLVKEVAKMLRASLPSTIEICTEVTQEGLVDADPTQLHQVLMNLCTNAAYAMREEGGKLTITLGEEDCDAASPRCHLLTGTFVSLTVSDTGEGIGPEDLERIFEPFFTTKPTGVGTGLGLSVVYGIVKSHGGVIHVQSAYGKGSTFTVYLPRLEEMTEIKPVPATELVTGTGRILFVDDEPDIVELGRMMLTQQGYEVEGRTSSVEALAAFQENPDKFDLVITDHTMPHLTGVKLGEALLRLRPDIPIIICTGFSERIFLERANALGFKAFLMKPLDLAALAQTVRGVLDESRKNKPSDHLSKDG